MFLNLLKKSSSLAFEYGNPIRLGVFGVFALALSWCLIDAYYFLVKIYLNERVLDVPSEEFYLPLAVFIILAFCGGFILRSIVIRLRLKLLLKKQLVIPEYTTPKDLTATEAGYLIDQSWSHNEVDALIAELVIAGIIYKQGKTWHLVNLSNAPELLYYHQLFIESVFNNRRSVADLNLRNVQSSEYMAAAIHNSLVYRGYIRKDFITTRLLPLFRFALFITMCYGLAMVWYVAENGVQALISNYGEVYPFHLWQLIAGTLIPLTLILTMLSGFIVQIDPRTQKETDSRFVIGFKLYLETVFSDRLKRYGQSTLDKEFLHSFYPYMVAFGIVNLDT